MSEHSSYDLSYPRICDFDVYVFIFYLVIGTLTIYNLYLINDVLFLKERN